MAVHTKINIHLASLIGIALGFSIAIGKLPAGFDAFWFYLREPFASTTAPAWVYLFTYPISKIDWPLGLQVLTFISVLSAGITCLVWDNKNWWIVIASPALLWNLWLGQIELFPVIGLLLVALILKKKIHPAWLGVDWLALLTKPQVGLGAIILSTYWIWHEEGRSSLLWAGLVSSGILAITLIIWPTWPLNWIIATLTLHPTWWNSSIWPWGFIFTPLVLIPKNVPRLQKLRRVLAITLLLSPYFSLYHCLSLLVVTTQPFAFILAWLIIFIGKGTPEQWMRWGWLLPAGILVYDFVGYYIKSFHIRQHSS